MNKSASLTKTSPLEAARAELERRKQRRNADLAQFGPTRDYDVSPQNKTVRRYQETHAALIAQADRAVHRLEFADTLARVKAEADAATEAAEAQLKTCRTAAEREAVALEGIAGRVVALQAQVAQLEAGRFAGIEVARAALTQRTAAGDDAGAAAAAQEVARIEADAADIDARLRPLRLQLAAVAELKTAAEERDAQVAEQEASAERQLRSAKAEVLALRRDEAAFVFREVHANYLASSAGTGGRHLPVEFTIGASARLLQALGKVSHDCIAVNGLSLQRDTQAMQPIDESVFAVDPLSLDDWAATKAKNDAEAAARRAETAYV